MLSESNNTANHVNNTQKFMTEFYKCLCGLFGSHNESFLKKEYLSIIFENLE